MSLRCLQRIMLGDLLIVEEMSDGNQSIDFTSERRPSAGETSVVAVHYVPMTHLSQLVRSLVGASSIHSSCAVLRLTSCNLPSTFSALRSSSIYITWQTGHLEDSYSSRKRINSSHVQLRSPPRRGHHP